MENVRIHARRQRRKQRKRRRARQATSTYVARKRGAAQAKRVRCVQTTVFHARTERTMSKTSRGNQRRMPARVKVRPLRHNVPRAAYSRRRKKQRVSGSEGQPPTRNAERLVNAQQTNRFANATIAVAAKRCSAGNASAYSSNKTLRGKCEARCAMSPGAENRSTSKRCKRFCVRGVRVWEK